jgi:hypothetical protein
MSKLSIYENSWIDLVFEFRNKEYGAYQLRQESTKTSLAAFSIGMLFIASVISTPLIINAFNPENKTPITIPDLTIPAIHIIDIIPNQLRKVEKTVLPEVKAAKTKTAIQNDQLKNPEIVQSAQADPDFTKKAENPNTTNPATQGTGTVGINPSAGGGSGTETKTPVDTGNTIVSSLALDKLPEFPGGMNKFYTYVGNNFEKQEIDGSGVIRVYVSFVIERDGSMTDIQVKKDPGYGLGKEAVRVLKSLKTKWTPGMIDSKPVRTAYNLPILVQLE